MFAKEFNTVLQRSILFRHLLAIGACIVVALALWTVVYVRTYMGNTPVAQADPRRYMIGGVMAIVYGLAFGVGIFAPASFVGSFFSRCFTCFEFVRQRPRLIFLAATPFVFASASFLSYHLDCFFMDAMTTSPRRPVEFIMRGFAIYQSLPLFFYWWFTAYRCGDEISATSRKSHR
jgi:hypothetical protein